MTSIEEIKIVREYVLKRELIRPKTNIIDAAYFIFLLLLVCFFISMILKLLLVKIPFILFFVLIFFSITFVLLKKIVIGMVELYQHYAPEYMRRRCLLMPTCSEYMIMAVKKYGTIRGVCKGVCRLFFRCRGNLYRIDYP
jgi:putative component of membrane protein insertase Oxa1/YidC/SpoIIIJ protein YidD